MWTSFGLPSNRSKASRYAGVSTGVLMPCQRPQGMVLTSREGRCRGTAWPVA